MLCALISKPICTLHSLSCFFNLLFAQHAAAIVSVQQLARYGQFFRHSKLVATKFAFDVNVISIVQSPLSGRMVLVKWQRGSKRSGTTKRVIISNSSAAFNESLEIKATLYKDAKKGKFDPKVLDLLVIEPKEKRNPS